MELLFDDHEQQVRSGGTARFRFRMLDGPAHAPNLTYRVEARDDRFDPRWCRVSSQSRRGGEGNGELIVEIPGGGSVPPGSYHLTLIVRSGAGDTATAECLLTVEASRCGRISARPHVTIDPDGSITASVSLLNCGNVDLEVSIDIRHQGGWRFEADRPDLTLQAGVGPFEAQLAYESPSGRTASPGDEVTVELRHVGTTLHRIDVRLSGTSAIATRRGRPSPWMLIAPLVVAIAGITTVASSPIAFQSDESEAAAPYDGEQRATTTAPSTTVAASVSSPSTSRPAAPSPSSTAPSPASTAPSPGTPTSAFPTSSVLATTTTLRPAADLSIDAQVTSAGNWILTVRNDGPANATSLVLAMTVEANAGFGAPASDAWTCTTGVSPRCTLDRLLPAQVTTVTVPLQLQACGSRVRATVTGREADPDVGDNNIGLAGADCPPAP